MFKLILKLFSLLTSQQRKKLYTLQIFIILMAIAEIVGIASIIPFMSLVGDMSQLQQNIIFVQLYQVSGADSESQFIFLLGICVLVALIISAMISMYTIWRLSMFGNKIGMEIADRLYIHYIKQNWLFHLSSNSAQLTKQIATETQRLTDAVLVPLMQMNARIILAFFLSLSIFIYDPYIAIVGFAIFSIAYFILFKMVKVKLQQNGKSISLVNEKRYLLMNEGFGGIKEVLLLGRDFSFIKRFTQSSSKLAYSLGNSAALSLVPRYFMELVAFGSMIGLVLYLLSSHNGNLGVILPIVSVYALANFKLLPAFQQIYVSLASIKGNIAAFESIQKDLIDSNNSHYSITKSKQNYLSPKQQISLKNISFTYPGKKEKTLNYVNMNISSNSTVGIVGSTGSGKSTIIDIILGLIKPDQGQLIIDDKIIDDKNRRLWQNTIGFVAQSIFLTEGSIAENVAFGIPDNDIDLDKVAKSLELADLIEFTKSLELGMHTKVGERGIRLSGGQRQRIGIARALYQQAEVLIFDEATSSLDGVTEKMIMNAIHDFSGKKTIVLIAHRLKTVQKCDEIFYLEKGRVIDTGTYDELIQKNENFRNMAAHA